MDAMNLFVLDRIAPYFDRIESMMEKMMFGDLRSRIWQQVKGENILEVGVGTGKNFAYYPARLRMNSAL
jgi:ubiquinone/menaquinone biosynthesis C-methylase UbiE